MLLSEQVETELTRNEPLGNTTMTPFLIFTAWSVPQVYDWARKIVEDKWANKLREQSVDGKALLLLDFNKLMSVFNLGTSVKLSSAIDSLKHAGTLPFNDCDQHNI